MKKTKTCVFKKDWKHYKTCYECGTLRKCKRDDKPKWYERIVEQLVIWWYRWSINRQLRSMFGGFSKRDIKRISAALKKTQKKGE